MIKLTLADDIEILINTNQIAAVISGEQAIIELKSGEKIEVKESLLTVLSLIKTFAYRDEFSQ